MPAGVHPSTVAVVNDHSNTAYSRTPTASTANISNNNNNNVNLTWTQRLNYMAYQKTLESQGFIWDSLDTTMQGVQEARKLRKKGPMYLITNRKDTSYNALRSTIRLQNAEKRKSDIRNFVSSIRLGLDYDLHKARVMALLNSKARTILFIMMDLAVDVLFCVLYLVEAQYLVDKDKAISTATDEYLNPPWLFVPRPRAIWLVAVAMSSWNVMSALIRFIFADSNILPVLWWRFIFSIQTLLDAVTAIPFLLSTAFLPHGQLIYVPYFLRSWSVISRLQRALSIGVDIGISDQPFDPVKAKLIALVAYFMAILYNGMAAFLYTETMFAPHTESPHTIGDAFYFILITASTVGYGDITPKSFEAKIVVMLFIIVTLSIVPGLVAGVIETLKSTRSGGGSYIQSRGANGVAKQYLVMIGDFQNAKRVSDMLSGFFNKEFSDSDVRVVFLSRNKPSKDVKTLLDMPMHKNRTTMLLGNGLDEVDLKRCQVRDAGGVFIIPDRVVSDLESQDTMTTLLAWSLHLYAPDTRVFTYNLLPETETFQWGIVEQSMCISDVKQLLLAYNCRHRGTATLILNLFHPSEPANSYDDGWQAQYGDGTGNELYVGLVPEVFVGWTFAQASWFIFQEFQSILIGVDIFMKSGTSTSTTTTTKGSAAHDDPHYHDSYNMNRSNTKAAMSSMAALNRDSGDMADGPILQQQQRQQQQQQQQNHYQEYDGARRRPGGQYHLTLNPGNSYRLGQFDQLIFVAQSPDDMDAINKFTTEQYERLLRDEHGPLDGSRVDFAKAMDMYFELRESRSEARTAAKRRACHRKGRKARQAEAMRQQQQYGQQSYAGTDGNEVLSSEQWPPETSGYSGLGRGPLSTSPSVTGSNSSLGSHFKKSSSNNDNNNCKQQQKKSARPAWNVALYDDDDDDDSLSDSSSLQWVRSGKSEESHQTGHSCHSRHSRNSQRQRGTKDPKRKDRQHRSSKDHCGVLDKRFLGGALDREEEEEEPFRRHENCDHIPMSEARFWEKSETSGSASSAGVGVGMKGVNLVIGRGVQAGSDKPVLLDKAGFYSSNFDRNATAAAVADAKGVGQDLFPKYSTVDTSSTVTNAVAVGIKEPSSIQASTGDAAMADSRATVLDAQEAVIPKSNADPEGSLLLQPTLVSESVSTPKHTRHTRGSSRRDSHASIKGSFQPLDDTTYIGQTSITRSETKDLPLCHLLIHPPASIKPLIRDDLSSLKNHIVVCANVGENLYRFLATLRLAQIAGEDVKAIVVLTMNPHEMLASDSMSILGDVDADREQCSKGPGQDGDDVEYGGEEAESEQLGVSWDAILSFPRVYWVAGNCRHQRDLVRAGILGASSIVIMSHSINGLDRDEFADSTAIMAHHMIYQTLKQRNLLGNQHIVVDILERSNIRFLNMRDLSMTRSYQAGGVMSRANRMGPSGFWMTPIFASGQVLVSSLLDNVLFQAYSKTHILDLVKLCCGIRFKQAIELDQILGIDCSYICLIETPAQFVGKSFLDLFQMLALQCGIIPLGLYRAPDRELNNALPFVFTNPLPGILLKHTDMIYVLKS
ncbi:hypothetical protein EDD11_009365 [Mortierella claussenii]|nr:hypothetical protein EDD11_009365 [Mortierella claussenii]